MDFTWAQCATALGVTEADLDDWVNDKQFPSPRTFRSLYDLVFNWGPRNPAFTKARELMNALLAKDPREITPLANQLEGFRRPGDCRTLDDYLALPVFEGFVAFIKCVSREQMEEILLEAAEQSRKLRDATPN